MKKELLYECNYLNYCSVLLQPPEVIRYVYTNIYVSNMHVHLIQIKIWELFK